MSRWAGLLVTALILATAFQGCLEADHLERDSMYHGPKPDHLVSYEGRGCLTVELSVRVNATHVADTLAANFTPDRHEGWGTMSLHILRCDNVTGGDASFGATNLTVASLKGEIDVSSPGLQDHLIWMATDQPALARTLNESGLPIADDLHLEMTVVRTHSIVERIEGTIHGGAMASSFQGTAVSIDTEVWPADRYWWPIGETGLRATVAHETTRLGGIAGEVHAQPDTPLETMLPRSTETASGRYTDSNWTLELDRVPLEETGFDGFVSHVTGGS